MADEPKLIDVWRVYSSASVNPIEHVLADKVTRNSIIIRGRTVRRFTSHVDYYLSFQEARAAAIGHITDQIDGAKRRLQAFERQLGSARVATEESVPISTDRY